MGVCVSEVVMSIQLRHHTMTAIPEVQGDPVEREERSDLLHSSVL